MSRSAVRVRSSALFFTCKCHRNRKVPGRLIKGLAAVGQQWTLSLGFVHTIRCDTRVDMEGIIHARGAACVRW